MVLVDTSVWVEHLRRGEARLAALLDAGEVLCHPLVVGELACGNLRRRGEILGLLGELPSLGSLVSLRVQAQRERVCDDRFSCGLAVLKDKRRGPTWTHAEVYRGPAGLR